MVRENGESARLMRSWYLTWSVAVLFSARFDRNPVRPVAHRDSPEKSPSTISHLPIPFASSRLLSASSSASSDHGEMWSISADTDGVPRIAKVVPGKGVARPRTTSRKITRRAQCRRRKRRSKTEDGRRRRRRRRRRVSTLKRHTTSRWTTRSPRFLWFYSPSSTSRRVYADKPPTSYHPLQRPPSTPIANPL